MQIKFMIPLIIVGANRKKIEKILEENIEDKQNLIIRLAPKTTEFSLGQVKEIIKDIKVGSPYLRIYIIEEFDHSSLEAQNAFLKTLEESPAQVRFILIVGNLHRLLPTIISRSKVISTEKTRLSLIDKHLAQLMEDFLKSGNLKIMNDKNFIVTNKNDALNLIDQLIIFFRSRLINDPKASSTIKEMFKVRDLIENNNLNPQLAVDHLLIFIKNKYC